jgi:dynamin 1/3
LQECNLEEVEEELSKSSKDSKKANGPEKTPSLVFKITNRVAYKTVLKGQYPWNIYSTVF